MPLVAPRSIYVPAADHLWQGGTTYGAIDGPGRTSMAAVLGPGGAYFGGTIGGMTGHNPQAASAFVWLHGLAQYEKP